VNSFSISNEKMVVLGVAIERKASFKISSSYNCQVQFNKGSQRKSDKILRIKN
jgi:hypothetical protein